jgi:hypothetical protein
MRVALILMLAAVCLGAKDPPQVRPQPADTYPAKDRHDGVTIAAVPYDTEEKSKAIFGRYDPLKVGVLPVYVVISNQSKDALRLNDWTVELMASDRQRAEPTPAGRVALMLSGRNVPRSIDRPRGPLPRLPQRADSKVEDALLSREFALQMVPPGDTVGGFLFFDTARRRNAVHGARLFLSHLTWGSTGKELFFFEIKLDDARVKPSAP